MSDDAGEPRARSTRASTSCRIPARWISSAPKPRRGARNPRPPEEGRPDPAAREPHQRLARRAEVRAQLKLEREVIKVLKTVYDPEIPVDIYDLGLVYDIDIDPENHVHVRMTLTAPGCPSPARCRRRSSRKSRPSGGAVRHRRAGLGAAVDERHDVRSAPSSSSGCCDRRCGLTLHSA